jgi:hypothetical protein
VVPVGSLVLTSRPRPLRSFGLGAPAFAHSIAEMADDELYRELLRFPAGLIRPALLPRGLSPPENLEVIRSSGGFPRAVLRFQRACILANRATDFLSGSALQAF